MFEPLTDGPAKGMRFKDLEGMLDEYYDALGWDKSQGIPTGATLKRLDMADVARRLARSV
jgi:aldehyde:ferredoxin oxidoreductase